MNNILVIPYEIVVYTSDKRNADTSANPYIVLYGDEIRTQQTELCKNKAERKDKFKRGAVDRFVLEVIIYNLKIRLKFSILMIIFSARRCWQRNKKDSNRS